MINPPTAPNLLAWYDRHRRELPWRVTPDMRATGVIADPYHVWLSEIMLQQTTVAAVKAYFEKFVRLWPTVAHLAAAETENVMKAWAGLGYYARARNLKKCAEAVVAMHGGRFPETSEELRTLPGIGDYTSAAIAAIAFDEAAPVMDGNVERVISRIFMVEEPLPGAKPVMKAHLATLTPQERPGDFAQAMMDLGATICTPKRPACALCPWRDNCRALNESDPELYPVKAEKKARPVRHGAAFVAVDGESRVLLRKRVASGLLGGMTEVPTTQWNSNRDGGTDASFAPFQAEWKPCGVVVHVFTHFELRLSVYRADLASPPSALPGISPSRGEIDLPHPLDLRGPSVAEDASVERRAASVPHPISPLEGEMPGRAEGGEAASAKGSKSLGRDNGWWEPVTNLDGEALPTVMKKAISAAIPAAFRKYAKDRS